jgi:hypothetical protein
MKWLLLLILALGLASCGHTALAPITTPAGVPVAVRIPDVPVGGQPRPSQVLAIDEKLLEGVTSETLIWKYFPELEGRGTAAVTLVGVVGEVQTKRGKRIHIYLPLVAMKADASAARVDEAAAAMGRDLYQRARKTCEVYPLSEISDQPPP